MLPSILEIMPKCIASDKIRVYFSMDKQYMKEVRE